MSESIRVAFVDHCARLSGAEIALARLAPLLPDVEPVVVLGEDGPLVALLREAGVETHVLPLAATARDARLLHRDGRIGLRAFTAAVRTTGYVLRLTRLLRRIQPDLVHTNSMKAHVYGSIAARIVRRPLLWHVHDRIAADTLPAPIVLVMRALSRTADGMIANSEVTLRSIPHPPKLTRVVAPPGNEVTPGPARDDVKCFGIVGRLSPWKGQDVFLRAFAEAFPHGDEVAVVIGSAMFGEEGYAAELAAMAHRPPLAGRVIFKGFRADVIDEYHGLDVLVHASVSEEPFGQVIIEGLAAGLPIVAAAAGGPLEILEDGTNGLLYPPGDVTALSNALKRVATDHDLRVALRANALRRADDYKPIDLAGAVSELQHLVVDASGPRRAQRRRRRRHAAAGARRPSAPRR